MRALVVDVAGDPIPQGSKSAYRIGRKTVVVDDNADVLKPWRKAITDATRARAALEGWWPLDGPAAADVVFYLRRLPAARKREFPHVPPDLDKLVRAVFDGLKDGGAVRDDSRIVDLTARKRYAEVTPGVRIVLTDLARQPALTLEVQ